MSNLSDTGRLIKDYIKLYPVDDSVDFSKKNYKKTLARLIVKENPHLYPGKSDNEKIESVRSVIRYHTGNMGDKNRNGTSHDKKDYFDHHARMQEYTLSKKHRELNEVVARGGARALIFDIETSPLMAYVWRLWAQDVHINEFLLQGEYKILTWSAKWLFEDEVINDALTPEEIENEDDSRIVLSLCNLIEQADFIVAYNGDKFDIRHVNARRLKHRMPPMLPYLSVDPYKTARKMFALPSYRMNYLAHRFLGIGEKIKTDNKLWVDVMNGDVSAIQEMVKYCDQDVRVLEDVYLYLRPYIKPHPNMGLFIEDNIQACYACGSPKLDWKSKMYYTNVNQYQTARCMNCGAVNKSRKADKLSVSPLTSYVPR